MKKIIANIRLFARGLRMAFSSSPLALTLVLRQPIQALAPFVNIYFSAMIIEQLTLKDSFEEILPNVLWAVGLNAVFYFLNWTFDRCSWPGMQALYIQEQKLSSQAMLALDYETLEDTDTQHKFTELSEHWHHKGSPLQSPIWDLSGLMGGIISIGASIYFLIPLFKIIFVRSGEGFLNSPWLAISVFIFIALGVGAVLYLSNKMSRAWFTMHSEYLKLEGIFHYYSRMLEKSNTGKEVRIYAQQELIERHASDRLMDEGVTLQRKLGNSQALQSGLLAIIGAILGFGVYLLIGVKGLFGFIGVGAIVRYMGSFLQVVNGLMQIGGNVGRLDAFIPGMRYFFDIVDLIPKHKSGKLKTNAQAELEIEFRDVSFKYPKQELYALRNVNFTLRGGEHLAIVGENGSGKTTFIKLMCRLYDPTEGEILLNGKNIKDYNEEEYRKLFGVVFQDYQLFAMPLGENVAAGTEIDEDKLALCLDESDFTPRLEHLEQGTQTWLYKDCSDDGAELSGGEAQKLALARALYKDSPVIVLDEPTAALDPLAEAAVYANFNRFAQGKAAIYISHRLSSCRFCEKVAVFEEGELVQYGGHEQLILNEDGKYFELWNAQAKYYV
ncbi:MAG: ABC transporter ATP-binding protein/permease [Oscillospiraceae bacterium]|nr:ABC transporter ATP-binding protein/permease [Oscillospiraceae bacterium]